MTVVGGADRATSSAGNSPPEGLFSRGGCHPCPVLAESEVVGEAHGEVEGYLATLLECLPSLLSARLITESAETRLTAPKSVDQSLRRAVDVDLLSRSVPFRSLPRPVLSRLVQFRR